MFLRTPFNYDTNVVSDETGLKCEDPSLTVQSMAADADINNIVKRFGVTGTLPQSLVLPTYADYGDILDYHTAMNAIRKADEAFMELPADIRSRFDNDAGKFVAFCSDRGNLDELRSMGLANKSEPVLAPDASSSAAGVSSTPSSTA